ncbi:MAG: VCBS repeat-containing protein [Caldilineaceae bacterium]
MRRLTAVQVGNSDAEIVYLDDQGYLRVQDTANPSGPLVQWVSPVGGWQNFALGDFNGDGDTEVVAIRGTDTGGELAIYDPVVATGLIETDKIINGIPWRTLFERTSVPGGLLTGSPLLVAAGELDPTAPGDEIVYVAELTATEQQGTNSRSRVVILHATDTTGGAWAQLADPKEFGNVWTQLAVGDADGSGVDDVVLVDDAGFLRLYRLQANVLEGYFDLSSESRPWQDAIVARLRGNPLPELVAVRSSAIGAANLWAFAYAPSDEGNFTDVYSEFFSPSPQRLFAGDVNGNGDEEIFFLRTVPNNNNTLPRLIMRNRGNDTLPVFEQVLETDNGFQAGAAADIDGDGKAEVILIRNTKLRIYDQPEVGTTFADYDTPVTANPQWLHAANLDQNGYVQTPEFQVTPSPGESNLAAGGQTELSFTITNVGVGGSIPFQVRREGSPTWLQVDGATGRTPATFTALLDARILATGVYTATLVIESSNSQVSNAPLQVPINLTVRPGLTLYPLSVVATPPACAAAAPTVRIPLTVAGPVGMTFIARILSPGQVYNATEAARAATGLEWPSAVPWVSAQSSNLAPTTLELTFIPENLMGSLGEATLELVATDAGGEQIRQVPLVLICTQSQVYLPWVAR